MCVAILLDEAVTEELGGLIVTVKIVVSPVVPASVLGAPEPSTQDVSIPGRLLHGTQTHHAAEHSRRQYTLD